MHILQNVGNDLISSKIFGYTNILLKYQNFVPWKPNILHGLLQQQQNNNNHFRVTVHVNWSLPVLLVKKWRNLFSRKWRTLLPQVFLPTYPTDGNFHIWMKQYGTWFIMT